MSATTQTFPQAAWELLKTMVASANAQPNQWQRDAIMAPNGKLITIRTISAVNDVIEIDGSVYARVMITAGYVRQ
jgi:hypothetical protein